jgi:hypothetical protein
MTMQVESPRQNGPRHEGNAREARRKRQCIRIPGSIEPNESGPEANDGVSEFDRELEPLLLDGPNLPADFSRADIYADHN